MSGTYSRPPIEPKPSPEYVNPKDVEALKLDKAPLDLLEPAADEATARAIAFGAEKYGTRNYVESPIAARVYVAAIRRHVTAWLMGEDYAPDSGVHHLGHIAANAHVAMAAIEAGTFLDDRPKRPEHVAEAFYADLVALEEEQDAEDELAAREEAGLPPVETVTIPFGPDRRDGPRVTVTVDGRPLGEWTDPREAIGRPATVTVTEPTPLDFDSCWDAPSEHRAAAETPVRRRGQVLSALDPGNIVRGWE